MKATSLQEVDIKFMDMASDHFEIDHYSFIVQIVIYYKFPNFNFPN